MKKIKSNKPKEKNQFEGKFAFFKLLIILTSSISMMSLKLTIT